MAKIPPALAQLYLSDGLRDLQRRAHRVFRRGRRRFTYIHELDDPYSLLTAQVLPRLVTAADAELELVIAAAPDPAFRPDPARLSSWGLRDAAGLALRHGLRFPDEARAPAPAALARARSQALACAAPPLERLALLVELSHALLAGEQLPAPPSQTSTARASTPRAAPHYMGAMIGFEGEWYWGLDRLSFLEQRLRSEGLSLAPTLSPHSTPRLDARGQLWGAPLPHAQAELELFYSLRSPYSYLVLARAAALAERHDLPLRLRLVLPMVQRGLAVPRAKRTYIIHDAARIAGDLGIAFGRVADPLAAVESLLGVAHYAAAEDRLVPWLLRTGSAAWAEGLDLCDAATVRALAVELGLDGDAALAARSDPSWRATTQANRAQLLELGLWGVPSLKLGSLSVWGQDRLDVIEAALALRSSDAEREFRG